MSAHPLAGRKVPPEMVINLARLTADYYTLEPAAPVSFGTSGHRGSAERGSFNENHVAAITAATLEYRRRQGYRGPLYLGYDTHALSEAAFRTVLTVLAAAGTPVIISRDNEYTPTPVISFLILEHNRQNPDAPADGLIITPSHNPPQDGGIKYNPPHGGPADVEVTSWIEKRANELRETPDRIPRIAYQAALKAETTRSEDFIAPFAEALGQVVDLEAVKAAGLKLGTDPLGGSGIHYWEKVAERWGLNLTVLNTVVDPSFSFMPLDSDGVVRMDCSSPHAMANLINMDGQFDLAFGNDPDFDRHGIVSDGRLMNPNHYLAVALDYLLRRRDQWPASARVGKTLVSSSLLNRVIEGAGRQVYETPVGFKWFVQGLLERSLVFGGEESAGASFLRRDGRVWTTDKDGFCMALLAAEIMAKTGKSPQERYRDLAERYGAGHYGRIDSNLQERRRQFLQTVDPTGFVGRNIAGRTVKEAYTKAPGNQASIGGLKVILDDGSWFALRPSGTEPKMKLYAESFSGEDTWKKMAEEGPKMIFGD